MSNWLFGRIHPGRILAAAMMVFVGALCGCTAVLGIEDAERDPLVGGAGGGDTGGAGGGGGASAVCVEYCEQVMEACSGDNAVYTTASVCENVCMTLPEGEAGAELGNSISCRFRNAQLADETGERALHCPRAGPGGGDACGDNCEGYCTIFAQACTQRYDELFLGLPDCKSDCEMSTRDEGTFNTSEEIRQGNTVQCRLYHVSAATADPNTHCPHAAGEAPCVDEEPEL